MNVVRWSPLPSIFEDTPFGGLDRLFGSLAVPSPLRALPAASWPQLDVTREDGEMVIRADVPGLSPEELTVEIQGRSLLISGERTTAHETATEGWLRSERTSGRFCRRIPLPAGVTAEQVRAGYAQGVLEVRLPEGTPAPETERIPIEMGGPLALPAEPSGE